MSGKQGGDPAKLAKAREVRATRRELRLRRQLPLRGLSRQWGRRRARAV
jgi:hypothetical protein